MVCYYPTSPMDNVPSLEEMAQAFKALQKQFNHGLEQINILNSALWQVTQASLQLKNQLEEIPTIPKRTEMPKLINHEQFKVKGSILSGIVYMTNYLREAPREEAIYISWAM